MITRSAAVAEQNILDLGDPFDGYPYTGRSKQVR